jgi:hypothetical protein
LFEVIILLDVRSRAVLLGEDKVFLRPIRMRLSLFCPSEAGVVGCCAVWGQQSHLLHLKEDCGTVTAGKMKHLKNHIKIT